MYKNFLKESISQQILNLHILKENEINPTPPPEEKTPPVNENPEKNVPPTPENTNPNTINTDMTATGVNDPMAMGGMPGMMQPLSLSEIGKIYTLKQIYEKLLSIQEILQDHNSEAINKVKDSIDQAIEMFQLVINNKDQYKDKMNDIITKFYRYLEKLVFVINNYFKEKNKNKYNIDKIKDSLSTSEQEDKKIDNLVKNEKKG